MRTRLGLLLATVLVVASCSNSPTDTTTGDTDVGPLGTTSAEDLQTNVPVDAPGVTDTEIRVGGVVSATNVLGLELDQSFKGVQAYFDMINSQGGIYGRDLVLVAERDDAMVNNAAEMQALISQDDVFAILPVSTLLFTGAQVAADSGTPTFGWNINPEWAGPENLFGEKGFICIDCALPSQPWLAQELGVQRIGLLHYSVDQSKECADGIRASFERWPTAEIAFADGVAYGETNYATQVSRMRDAEVDFVVTCLDTNGAIALAREMDRQQLDAPQYMQNAYSQDVIDEFGDLLEGNYVLTIPASFEVPDPPPGLRTYFEWIDKVDGAKRGEWSLSGWLNADLLYRGLVGAGPEFSQAKVVAAINQIDDWNADGVLPHINWTIEHERMRPDSCGVVSRIEGGAFVPIFATPGKPFMCIDNEAEELRAENRS